jgi:RimJ/RimL family protein N-acetyltransferase
VTHRYWPVLDIRLHVGDLVLHPLTEADLATLTRALPPDVELNPASPRYAGTSADSARGTIVHQDYWRAMGTWTVDAWRLNFGVWRGDALLGTQELEGNDFATLRTVDTASFLVPAARGAGIGKQMRRAVLSLAFGPLAAEYAITSAWHDNAASLGVSRSLGYVDNGVERHRREARAEGRDDWVVDDMVHLRLSRGSWLASGLDKGVAVDCPDSCLAYFGVA